MAATVSLQTGDAALRTVAQDRGQWNWALVRPDPEALPLVGCGAGSIDEMRECLENNMDDTLYGLLRVVCGTGRLRRTKYISVHAIRVSNSGERRPSSPIPQQRFGRTRIVSRMDSVKDMEKRGEMERKLGDYATVSLNLEVTSLDELEPESVLERLKQKIVVDDEIEDAFSVSAFKEALKAEAAERAADLAASRSPTGRKTMRRTVSAYEQTLASAARSTGNPEQTPEPNARAREILAQPPKTLSRAVSEGALELARPPRISGCLMKQGNNILGGWRPRYFEVKDGVVQYWMTPDEARSGRDYRAAFWLSELKIERSSGGTFVMQGMSNDPGERTYTVDANIPASYTQLQANSHTVEEWLEALEKNAHYANQMPHRRPHIMPRKGSPDQQGEGGCCVS